MVKMKYFFVLSYFMTSFVFSENYSDAYQSCKSKNDGSTNNILSCTRIQIISATVMDWRRGEASC